MIKEELQRSPCAREVTEIHSCSVAPSTPTGVIEDDSPALARQRSLSRAPRHLSHASDNRSRRHYTRSRSTCARDMSARPRPWLVGHLSRGLVCGDIPLLLLQKIASPLIRRGSP